MPVADSRLRIPATVTLVVTVVVLVSGADQPGSNLDYWLSKAKPTSQPASRPVTQPGQGGRNPFKAAGQSFARSDALPGVIELSNGRVLAGGVYGTRDAPWKVWVTKGKCWRQIPQIAVLSLSAVVVEQRMQLQWRWKETGTPEKIYTGKQYPWRRFLWRIKLIDGTEVTGAIKGQPIWIETAKGQTGPLLLHERQKGPVGTTLKDLLYVRRVIISRRLLDLVRAEQTRLGAE